MEIWSTIIIGSISIVISFLFGRQKNRIEKDRLFKELFESFNNKYNNKLNDIFTQLRLGVVKEINEDEKLLIIEYFNLCAEEYLWYTKKVIPNPVWKSWEAGMKENIKIPQILKIYKTEMENVDTKISYYGLYEKLNIN